MLAAAVQVAIVVRGFALVRRRGWAMAREPLGVTLRLGVVAAALLVVACWAIEPAASASDVLHAGLGWLAAFLLAAAVLGGGVAMFADRFAVRPAMRRGLHWAAVAVLAGIAIEGAARLMSPWADAPPLRPLWVEGPAAAARYRAMLVGGEALTWPRSSIPIADVSLTQVSLDGGVSAYAAVLPALLERVPVDALVLCLDVTSDLTRCPPPRPAWWRPWGAVALAARWGWADPTPQTPTGPQAPGAPWRQPAARLAHCRAPQNESLRGQWDEGEKQLVDFVAQCEQRGVALAIVACPAHFQIDRSRADRLARRAGLPLDELDLALPQRRLAALAGAAGFELLDPRAELAALRGGAFHRDGTLTDAGRATIAALVAAWLDRQAPRDVVAHRDEPRR